MDLGTLRRFVPGVSCLLSNPSPTLFHRWTLLGPQCHQRHSLVHLPTPPPWIPTPIPTKPPQTRTHTTLSSSSPIVYQHRKSPLTISEDSPEHVDVYYSRADTRHPFFVHVTDVMMDWNSTDLMSRPAGSLDFRTADGTDATGRTSSAAHLLTLALLLSPRP